MGFGVVGLGFYGAGCEVQGHYGAPPESWVWGLRVFCRKPEPQNGASGVLHRAFSELAVL